MAGELIYVKISKVMADIGAVGKNRKNQQQNYAFRGIEDFYNAAHPAMVANGVFCCPEVLVREEYRFTKANDRGGETTWLHVTLKVRHRFYCEDGSYIDVTTVGEGLDNSDKASNKAMSGAMKYALIELFSVPTEDVEDADRTTPEQGVKPKTIEKPVRVGSTPPPPVTAFPENNRKFLSDKQKGLIAQRFRESLSEKNRSLSEKLRHDALTVFGYVDEFGNPSMDIIPAEEFEEAGRKLVKFAKEL